MVVVCGNNMGDIFRRSALNLGLEVVQSPEAVADARDGDEFQLRSNFEASDERDARDHVRTGAAHRRKEDDIRRTGGIFALGRREFHGSIEAMPRIEWPDPERARGMTSTAQIVWAHRVDKQAEVKSGATIPRVRRLAARLRRHGAVRDPHVQPDHRRQYDLSAPGGDCQRPLRVFRPRERREADGYRPAPSRG